MTRPSGANLTPEETMQAQDDFLAAYAKRGNVGAAAAVARVHRSTVYRWQEHDETFGVRFAQVQADYRDALRDEIDRRARRGWMESVFGPEGKIGAIQKHSDTLLIFQAKAQMPEYRERTRVEMTGADGGPMQTTHTLDLGALQAVLMAALANHPEAQYAVATALAQLDTPATTRDASDGAPTPA